MKLIVWACVVLIGVCLSGCESGSDNQLAQKIWREVIEPALIQHKVCIDSNDCEKKNVALYSISDGVVWKIYATSDRQAINDVMSKMIDFSKYLPRNKTFMVLIYSLNERDVGYFDKPIAQLSIQGAQVTLN